MRRKRSWDFDPIWKGLVVGAIIAGLVWGAFALYQMDQRWKSKCREVYHGVVQEQTWSGYGYHIVNGKMIYGYYSTTTTVCRLVSGPNAGVVIDTE